MNTSFTFSIFVFLCLHTVIARLLPSYGSTYPTQSCTRSSQCPKDQCCRNNKGDLVGDPELGWGLIIASNKAPGTCSDQKSGAGGICLSRCGCIEGYTCYRPLTGICCPPKTCWETEKAEADKLYWTTCRPPNCHFPPSANPSHGPL